MPRQRILLVDDHEVVRLGLKALIERQPDMVVVAEADTATKAVSMATAHQPDAVVMDIRLGNGSGIDACREIMAQLPATKVIMLTSYAEDDVLFAAIQAGAAGYVLKQAGGRDCGPAPGHCTELRVLQGRPRLQGARKVSVCSGEQQ